MSRWPIYCLRCRSAIHFLFNFSEIKSERLRESQREKERNTLSEGRMEHRVASTEHRSRGRAICVLRSPICDEGWPSERRRARLGDDDGNVTVRGLLGLVLVCVLGIFFFFFDKYLCALCLVCWVLCVWFAFVLGFDLFASDDATWWDSASDMMGSISDSLYIYIFFGWESVGLPWASYL